MPSSASPKRPAFLELLLLLGILAVALVPRFFFLKLRGFELFNSDQAVIGLMARHILEGKPMVYFYGQGYMGSLEAFLAAFLFILRGANTGSLFLAPLLFYLAFLVVNFFLLKRLFGLETAVAANLFLALSPPTLTTLSFTALGGYPETLFFGSLVLLGLALSRERQNPNRMLFWTGLAAGIGFWVNNLLIMYFLALGIFLFLRSGFWKRVYPFLTPRRLFLLEGLPLPLFLRFFLALLHLGIAVYFLWQVFSFFSGPEEWHWGVFHLKTAVPPFHVKALKAIVWIGIAETALWFTAFYNPQGTWNKLKPSLPFFGGMFLGASPAWIYYLWGGKGYRLIHASGTIVASDLPEQFRNVIWLNFLGGILGAEPVWLSQGPFPCALFFLILCLTAGFLGRFLWLSREDFRHFKRFSPFPYSYSFFPFLVSLVTLTICFFNTLQSVRYLIPVYFAVSLIIGTALSQSKNKYAAWFCFLALLAGQAFGNMHHLQSIPKNLKERTAYPRLLHFFDEQGIRGGYANYWLSYQLTFESREKIILAPYQSQERYPAYTEYVDRLDKAAYLFRDNQAPEEFEAGLKQKSASYEKFRVDPFWVFVVDRHVKSEI